MAGLGSKIHIVEELIVTNPQIKLLEYIIDELIRRQHDDKWDDFCHSILTSMARINEERTGKLLKAEKSSTRTMTMDTTDTVRCE